MNNRQSFDAFVETAFDAFTAFATDERSRVSIDNVFAAARKADPVLSTGSRRPVCERYLPALLLADYGDAKLNRMMACFSNIERHIRWQPRPVSNATASKNFADNHANGMIIGQGGIAADGSIMIGVSFLGPNVRYPDHDHAPDETYLVMTAGEFRQNDDEWFSPGCGGSFYNIRGIKHAMRSGAVPLLAFWVLHV